jgi:hypothetical protein
VSPLWLRISTLSPLWVARVTSLLRAKPWPSGPLILLRDESGGAAAAEELARVAADVACPAGLGLVAKAVGHAGEDPE